MVGGQSAITSIHFVQGRQGAALILDGSKDEKDRPRRWASLHELLVAGKVDFAARKPTSLCSNRLVLPGFDAIDHAKFDSEAKSRRFPKPSTERVLIPAALTFDSAGLRKQALM